MIWALTGAKGNVKGMFDPVTSGTFSSDLYL